MTFWEVYTLCNQTPHNFTMEDQFKKINRLSKITENHAILLINNNNKNMNKRSRQTWKVGNWTKSDGSVRNSEPKISRNTFFSFKGLGGGFVMMASSTHFLNKVQIVDLVKDMTLGATYFRYTPRSIILEIPKHLRRK